MNKIITTSIVTLALGAAGLGLAGAASAAPECTRTETSVTCTGNNGSFSATHTPGRLTINGHPITRHYTVDVNVHVRDNSMSFSRDSDGHEFTATIGDRTVSVTNTFNDGHRLPKVTVTKPE